MCYITVVLHFIYSNPQEYGEDCPQHDIYRVSGYSRVLNYCGFMLHHKLNL